MPTSKRKPLKFAFEPLTPHHWADCEALFGPRGACGGCWCMAWRLPRKTWEANKGAGNRQLFLKVVNEDVPPGVIAYHDDRPVGWVSVAPREKFDYLRRSRVLKPIDDKPVWSVSCLYVHKDYRRQGVSVALLKAACALAKAHGGKTVEGYPVVPYQETMPAVFAWTGTLAAFLKAGFREVARGSPARPIVRKRLQ